jgi:hypothetical protein
MKKLSGFCFLLFTFLLLATAPACKAKYGCEAQESLRPKVNKKGELKSSKRKKSDLFPKSVSKKMKH